MSEAKENPGYVNEGYLKRLAEITGQVKKRSYELMEIGGGHSVLDVGCGPATDTVPLARLVGPSGRVAGVDYDEEMIAKADSFSAEAGVAGRVSHRQADAASLPFGSDCFHGCRSERVFQHLLEPEKVLAEMIRVTKPGGRIVLVDTDWGTLSVDAPDAELERRIIRFRAEKAQNNGYSGRQLYRLLKKRKLEDVRVELFGLYLTDYALARLSIEFDRMEKLALEAGAVTPEELARWRKSLEKADREGAFFASATQVIASARKPAMVGY